MTKDQIYGQQTRVKPSEVTTSSGTKFIGATFLYFTIALVITFAVVAALGSILNFAIFNNDAVAFDTIYYILAGALVAYIPVLIWVHIAGRRNGATLGPAFFTYSIVMGVLLSPICVIFDFWTIAIALGSTALAFAVMALIAWTTKKDLSKLAIFGFGLLIGVLVLSLFNLIFYFVAPATYTIIYALVSSLFFIVVLIFTIVDLNNVKKIAENGGAARNVAFLCALNLYVDFIYIFIRLLRIIAIIAASRK